MTVDVDAEALHRHLDKHPDDWDARRVLADLYEEQGKLSLAGGQRWQAENGKHPMPPGVKYNWLGKWAWWETDRGMEGKPWTLGKLWRPLHQLKLGVGNWWNTFTTRREAEEALAQLLLERLLS